MKWLVVLFLLTGALSVNAGKKIYGNVVVSEVVSIYDADTFRVNIEGWPDILGENIPIRILGVDAPEIRGKCQSEKRSALAARAFTVAAVEGAAKIELKDIQRGKYFRLLANVYIDGVSLSQMLIEGGYGRPYTGGKRAGWCNAGE
ncbi:Thermonuclease [hydrothermal vent metagenome]|uniref:Thermonuclease n=1 Tax=hydrothermal vent metagenome TaxID=652676 RepID=A0A3B0X8B5_9ZZZZ